MKEIRHKLLSRNEFKVFRVIHIERKDSINFNGYLPYTRNFDPVNYSSSTYDDLDNSILSAIQDIYPESKWIWKEDIFYQSQIDDRLRKFSGIFKKPVTIQICPPTPSINDFSNNICLTCYQAEFQLRLMVSEESTEAKHVQDFFHSTLDKTILSNLVNSIQSI